jgi:hypothetical protein
MNTPLLTTSEVGRVLNLSSERVRQLAREEKLRPAQITPLGQLWDPVEVQRFAEARRKGAA